MKPSELFRHMETKHPALKDKPLEFSKRKKREHEEQKQLLKATTSSNVSALRASFLVPNHIAKAKKPFTGLPWRSSGKESALQCRGHGFDPWSGN